MESVVCVDCGGTIPANEIESASCVWIYGKGQGLCCRACDEAEMFRLADKYGIDLTEGETCDA